MKHLWKGVPGVLLLGCVFCLWFPSCGGGADKVDEGSFDYCKVIRRVRVLPQNDGSAEWQELAENTPERIWLLSICFPEDDTVTTRLSIDISVEEEYPVVVEFDTIRSFPDARSAKEYAAANRIVDIVL